MRTSHLGTLLRAVVVAGALAASLYAAMLPLAGS
jgi:hypothetical protein